MVDGDQIVYERYSNETETAVDYEYVNYVNGGKVPILEHRTDIIHKNFDK